MIMMMRCLLFSCSLRLSMPWTLCQLLGWPGFIMSAFDVFRDSFHTWHDV